MCTAVLIAQWFIGNPEKSMNGGVTVWGNTMAGWNCEIFWTLVMARKITETRPSDSPYLYFLSFCSFLLIRLWGRHHRAECLTTEDTPLLSLTHIAHSLLASYQTDITGREACLLFLDKTAGHCEAVVSYLITPRCGSPNLWLLHLVINVFNGELLSALGSTPRPGLY